MISFISKNYRLTQVEIAVLFAAYKELDRRPNMHVKKNKITRNLITRARGGIEIALDSLVRQRLIQKKPTGGGMTYSPTHEGADLAEFLYPKLFLEVPIKVQKIADDMDIDPSFVKEIFNMDSSSDLPTFSYQFEEDKIKKNQRIIGLLSLYYGNIQKNNPSLSRTELEAIFLGCNISMEGFDKRFRRKPWRDYLEISGENYSILSTGMYKARKIIKDLLKL